MRLYAYISLAFFLFLLCPNAFAGNFTMQLVTPTKHGKLQGTVEKNICVWRGIKYAEASRFGYPHACPPWSGVKEAVKFGPVATQTKSLMSSKEPQSEDCLYLNIWS